MKIIFTIGILLLVSWNSRGQNNLKPSHLEVELGYLTGIGDVNYDDQAIFKNTSSAYRLRLTYFRTFFQNTSIGIGAGLDGYQSPNLNTLPLFLAVRQEFYLGKTTFLTFLNVGSAVKLSQEFERGFHFSSGIGMPLLIGNKLIVPSLGFNLQNISEAQAILLDPSTNSFDVIQANVMYNSISFNVALRL